MDKLQLRTHSANENRIFIKGKGLVNSKTLAKILKNFKGEVVFETPNAYEATVRALIRQDPGLDVQLLLRAIRAGSIFNLIKELE